MTIKLDQNDGELIVTLSGRLDTMTAPDLETELEKSLVNVSHLVFDMKELEYISSAGLRVLLNAMQVMETQGDMVLRNVCDRVMEIFEITGFLDDLVIE